MIWLFSVHYDDLLRLTMKRRNTNPSTPQPTIFTKNEEEKYQIFVIAQNNPED